MSEPLRWVPTGDRPDLVGPPVLAVLDSWPHRSEVQVAETCVLPVYQRHKVTAQLPLVLYTFPENESPDTQVPHDLLITPA